MPQPTPLRLLTWWTVDPGLALAVTLSAVLYAVGVRRLARRGRRWSPGRSVAFASGLAVITAATMSGAARYDDTLFSLHVVQHLALGIAAPFLLALGAPVTLALQASSRPWQRTLLRVVHSRPIAVVTHPAVAWLLFGGSMFALYFTPLFEQSLRHPLVHEWVHVHFVVVGCLFFWPAVGLDPLRRRLSHGLRLLYVLVAVPFHAFLGVALLGSDRLLAGGWYGRVARSWGGSALSDQKAGAGILWASGELLGLAVAAVIAVQWMRWDERRQRREDRRLAQAA